MQYSNIQLIIPMSGIGKRFIESGYTDPKPLILVDGYPIIKHVVDMFPGVSDITFICNESHIGTTDILNILNTIAPGSKMHIVPNENRKGPVDAVRQIFEFIDDEKEVIVSYCDYGTVWDFDRFIKTARSKNWHGAIPCYTGFHPHMLGGDNYAFCKEEEGTLVQIKEKESFTDDKMSEFASNGAYYFKSGDILKKYFKELIELDINLKGEYYVSLVYNLLVRDGLKVGIFEIEKMLQWGTPYDLEVYKSWSSYFSKNKQKRINNPSGTVLILPMAGKGSRFADEGYPTPKPLIEVDGEPMIVQAVNCLPTCDANIFICLDEHVNNHKIDEILKAKFPNTKIKTLNTTTEGQACTCEIGMDALDAESPILISACDNGVVYNENNYAEMVNDNNIDIIVWSFRNNPTSKNTPNMYSWLEVDDKNNILNVSCKKFIGKDPLTTHAIIGTMFFRKGKYFLDGLKKNYEQKITTNNEYYVDDVINQCIKAGLSVKVFEVDNYICWGTPDDYKTYNYWKEHFSKTR